MAEKSRLLFVWLAIAFIAVSVYISRAQMLGNCELPDLLLAMRNCEANFVLALCHTPGQDCWNHQNITTVNACAKTSLRNCFEGTVTTESLDPMVDTVWNNLNYNVTEEYCTGDKFEGPFFPSNDGTPACSQEYPDVLTSCETDFFQKYLANISDPTLCREFGAMTTCKLSAVDQHCNLTDDNMKLLNATWGTNYNPFCLCPNVEPTTHAPTTPRQTATPLGRCSVDDLIRKTQQCESEFIYALCTNPDIDCLTHPELPTLENCTRDVYHDCIVGIFPDAMVEGFLANFVLTLNAAGLYCNGTTFQPADMRTSGEGEECTQQYSNDSAACVEAFIGYYLSNKSHPELCREYTKMTDCKNTALEEHCHSVHFNKLYEIRLRLSSDYNPFCQCPNQYGVSTTTTTTPVPRSSTVTAPLQAIIGTAEMMTETSNATELVTTKRETTPLTTSASAATNVARATSNTPTVTTSVTTITPAATTIATQTASTMTTVDGTSQVPTYPTTMTTTTLTVTTSVASSARTTAVTTPRIGKTATTTANTATQTVSTMTDTSTAPSTTPLTLQMSSTMPTTTNSDTTTREMVTTSTTREMDPKTPTTREMDTTTPTTREMDTTTPITKEIDTPTPTTREMATTTPTTVGVDTTMPTVKEVDTPTSTTRDPDTTTPTLKDTTGTTTLPIRSSARITRTITDKNNESDRTTEQLETAEEQGPPVAVIAAAAGGVTVLGVGSIVAYVIKLKVCKPSRVYVA